MKEAQLIASLITNELFAKLKREKVTIDMSLIRPRDMTSIAGMISDGMISRSKAKEVIDILWEENQKVIDKYVHDRNLQDAFQIL